MGDTEQIGVVHSNSVRENLLRNMEWSFHYIGRVQKYICSNMTSGKIFDLFSNSLTCSCSFPTDAGQ
jgi:hypothetical protein